MRNSSSLCLPSCTSIFIYLFVPSFPGSSVGKGSACSAGDLGSINGLGRSPGEGNGKPLQYSCLENLMDRGACGLQTMWSKRGGHDWTTKTSCSWYKGEFGHMCLNTCVPKCCHSVDIIYVYEHKCTHMHTHPDGLLVRPCTFRWTHRYIHTCTRIPTRCMDVT